VFIGLSDNSLVSRLIAFDLAIGKNPLMPNDLFHPKS